MRISLKAVVADRERSKIAEFKKENTSKRAGIEGSNSALKRTGMEKLNVRVSHNPSVLHFSVFFIS